MCRTHLIAVGITVALVAGGWWAFGRKTPIRTAPPAEQLVKTGSLVQASNVFGFKVAGALYKEDPDRQNLLISPLGLSQCLGLLLEGSRGPERDEVKMALGLAGIADEDLGRRAHTLTDSVLSDPERPLALANAVFIARPGAVSRTFEEKIESDYAGKVFLSGDPTTATKDINDWTRDNTNGMIPSILDSVDPNMDVAFLNASHFEARWEIEFDPSKTNHSTFTTLAGKEVNVPIMFGRSFRAKCLKEEGLEGVLLNYKGGQFSMAAFLPPVGEDVLSLLPKLRAEGIEHVLKRFTPNKFSIGLPKFNFQSTLNLNATLQSLGIRSAYMRLDCSPIAPDLSSGRFLDDVRQAARIEVDESGTRASQTTLAKITKSGDALRFLFRRPFLYLIVHNPSGAVVFLGICGDPSQTGGYEPDRGP